MEANANLRVAEEVDANGDTRLHCQLRSAKITEDELRHLLKSGADPTRQNYEGRTPLHLVTSQNIHLAPLLVQAGADVEAKDHTGATWLSVFVSTWLDGNTDFLRTCLGFGANPNTRDFAGRSLLHVIVGRGYGLVKEQLQALIKVGLDSRVVDFKGNTLYHEAILSSRTSLELLSQVAELDIDFNQPNHSGHTPLHILSSFGMDEPVGKSMQELVREVVRRSNTVDVKDHKGITPLHTASTVSEYLVCELLASGADPTIQTHEGLTSLHLATRARQTNIVGTLLDCLRAKGISETSGDLNSWIQTKDKNGRTPLYYACQSGRPETVRILLEAGADPRATDNRQRTLLDACAEFESEQALWQGYKRATRHEQETDLELAPAHLLWLGPSAAGLQIHDSDRPFVRSGREIIAWLGEHPGSRMHSCQDSARLDEILDILCESWISSGTEKRVLVTSLNRSIMATEMDDYRYTLMCLKSIQRKLNDVSGAPASVPAGSLTFRDLELHCYRQGLLRAVSDASDICKDRLNADYFQWLLKNRDYDAILELAHKGTDFLATNGNEPSHMSVLVQHGFADLISKLSQQIHPSVAQSTSLLLEASKRELPNLEVIRVLVKKMGADVNGLVDSVGGDSDNEGDEDEDLFESDDDEANQGEITTKSSTGKRTITSLHYLARGMHWWHAAQGIPWMVKVAGADIEVRNGREQTPLHIAVSSSGTTFGESAARTLLELGADSSAVDASGMAAIDFVGVDSDMYRLLLTHKRSSR